MRTFWIRMIGGALILGLLAGCAPAGADLPVDEPAAATETRPPSETEPPATLASTPTALPSEAVTQPVVEPTSSPTLAATQFPPTKEGGKAPAIVTDAAPAPVFPLGTTFPTQPATTPQTGLENNPIVAQAVQDLADQLNISTDQIQVLEAQAVVWSDGSLGCPQPGMAYIQVLQEGMLIRLGVGETVYEYHSGENRPPFLCTQPG